MSVLMVFLVMLVVGMSMAAVSLDKMKFMNQVDQDEDLPIIGSRPMGIPLDVANKPDPCCTPDQWEGIVSGFVGYRKHWFSRGQLVSDMFYFSYDATNQRIAMNGTTYIRGKPIAFHVIELYKEKKIYVIDAEGKCVSHDVTMAFHPACIPEGANFLGRFSQGLGEESMKEESWMFEAGGYHIIFNVTPQQCIPVSETVWGKGEGRHAFSMFSGFGYVNISPGIKSKSVFTPPKDCPSGDVELGEGLMQFMHNKISGQ